MISIAIYSFLCKFLAPGKDKLIEAGARGGYGSLLVRSPSVVAMLLTIQHVVFNSVCARHRIITDVLISIQAYLFSLPCFGALATHDTTNFVSVLPVYCYIVIITSL